MDSTLVAAGIALANGVSDLKDRYAILVEDKDYLAWVTQDTSDEKILSKRIKKAIEVLAG